MAAVSAEATEAALARLREDGAAPATVASFGRAMGLVASGDSGLIPEGSIEPVDSVEEYAALEPAGSGERELLDATVVIKLNGGLGTSMGMSGPKSLLEVKDGLSFLEITARQVSSLRERAGGPRLPLVLLDSFRTAGPSLELLEGLGGLSAGLPADFLQGRVPKLLDDGSLMPVSWPADPELEWSPPGHGDLYPALVGSGLLGRLREEGFRYAFVSNADNLGAVVDPSILAWMARDGVPFAMEVARRTEADRKGGHIARRADGSLVLREIAQTPEGDREAFADIERHRFFNTNSIWFDLDALAAALGSDGVIDLPLIVNRKTVDPSDPSSPAVLQLETAVGAALSAIPGARALLVPRSRFMPVKTTDDLLVLRSDAYRLEEDGRLAFTGDPSLGPPVVELDPSWYRLIGEFEDRFPAGPPSLRECRRLEVRGDVLFEGGVQVVGDVVLDSPDGERMVVAAGTRLAG
jgi:UTP--glucose-1-phosphate uridylyltransferase